MGCRYGGDAPLPGSAFGAIVGYNVYRMPDMGGGPPGRAEIGTIQNWQAFVPLDPDLVEQRIGRLDRIGRSGAVHIHVPYIENTGAEVLARWHHEGVGVFEHPVAVGHPLLEEFGKRVAESACGADGDLNDEIQAALKEAVENFKATGTY